MDNFIENLDKYALIIFAVLGVASAVARLTPNDSDNKIIDAIYKVLNKLGLRGGPTG